MLNEQSRIYQRLIFFADLALIAIGWIVAYYLRFHILVDLIPLPLFRPLSRYTTYILPLVGLWGLVFMASGLYAPRVTRSLPSMIFAVIRAVLFGMATGVAAMFFYRAFSFSRVHMLLFGIVTALLMVILRLILYWFSNNARKRGANKRNVLIVGAGETGRRLAAAFERFPLMGLNVIGFLDNQEGPDVIGKPSSISAIVDEREKGESRVDAVYVTLPFEHSVEVNQIVDDMSTRLANVYMVPDLLHFDIMNSRVSTVEGMPVIHLIDESPLEVRRVGKRIFDFLFSLLVLTILSPFLLLIAIGVKLSSRGPVFYKQERMSLNGQRFKMLKFRSMPVGTESSSGPVWAKSGESRATKIGGFLRKTSLDELPQFINVLKGDMSVVGPRPERPVFIEDFKSHVPGYMFRHKMKGGITGWAQVNGWRGDTSIEKRIEYDLHYIRNWSLGLDFKIIFLTLFKGFVNKNAY